jgi:hypothetical protein
MVLASPQASAKGSKDKDKGEDPAVTIYKQAVDLFQQEKYEAAIELFSSALEHGAPSLTLYNIARCHESLGDLEKAAEYYQLYIEAPDAADIGEVEAHIVELENEPSKVSIVTDPEGVSVSEVLADGSKTTLGTTPLEFEAEAGTHSYVLDMDGFKKKKIKIKTGLGKQRDIDVTLTAVSEEPVVVAKPPRETLGLVFELGGGLALHIKELFQPGGDVSLGVGWRFAHGPATGFAVGLRANVRPYALAADLSSGGSRTYGGLFAAILAVPAFQVKLHERVGLEMTLPLGLAFLDATETIPSTAMVELLGGTLEGGGLTLFDIGFGASVRIMIVSGLFVAVEPLRIQLLVPTSKWLSDTKVLFDMDFTVRIGFEI